MPELTETHLPQADDKVSGFTELNVMRYYGGDLSNPFESPAKVAELIPIGARVLDIGCSSGELTDHIRQSRKVAIVGVEPQPGRAQAAKALGLDVHEAFLTPLLLESIGIFDIIILVDVLEHLAAPEELLSFARKGLAPGGSIIISTPNVAHWTIRLNLLRGRFDYEATGLMDVTHLRWFTRKNLRQLMKTCGYRIVLEDVSAGAWLPQYRSSWPWRWIPAKGRRRLVRYLADHWPKLFGCQHIVKAVPLKNVG